MIDRIDTCAYCGRGVEQQLLEQLIKGDEDLLSVICEDSICCIKFRCDDDWQATLEKLIGKKMVVKDGDG